MDTKDKKILSLLVENARIPLSDICREVHLSRNAVKNRVAKMLRTNVIKGFTTLLGDGNPVSQPVIALIMIKRKDRMRGRAVFRYAESCNEVKSCFVMSGELDVVMKIQVSSNDRVKEIWSDICSLPDVEETNTTFVLSTVKNDTQF